MKEKHSFKHGSIKNICSALCAAVFWLSLWALAAWMTGRDLLLPSPLAVCSRLLELSRSLSFWLITFSSLIRVFLGLLAGLIIGVLLAVLCCRFKLLDTLLSPVITLVKSTPVASFIILALVWLGRAILPSFISCLMVFPIVFTNVKTGIKQTPHELIEMSTVFGLDKLTRIKRVYAPSTAPHFISAVNSSLGLSWKAGVAAEVLAFTPDSIGRMLSESKNYLETTDLFAWTAVIVILSLMIEQIFTRLITRTVGRVTGGRL